MQHDSNEYYRMRERSERIAARHASSQEARRIHRQLAQAYAELAQRA